MAGLSGLLSGVATLTRPVCLYLPILLFVWLLAARRRWPLAVVFALASAPLPAAWIARNYRVSHVATISSGAGETLLLYHAAGTLVVAHEPALSAIFALQRQSGFYRPALKLRTSLVTAALTHGGTLTLEANHAQRARQYRRLGARIIREHPVAYAEIFTSSVIALLFDNLAYIAASRGQDVVSARLVLVPLSAGLFILAALGCAALIRRYGDIGWPVTICLAYFIGISAFPEVEPRFYVPFSTFYALAVGAGLSGLIPSCRPMLKASRAMVGLARSDHRIESIR